MKSNTPVKLGTTFRTPSGRYFANEADCAFWTTLEMEQVASTTAWLAPRVRGLAFADGRAFVRSALSLAHGTLGRMLTSAEVARVVAAARAVWHSGQPRPAGLPGRAF